MKLFIPEVLTRDGAGTGSTAQISRQRFEKDSKFVTRPNHHRPPKHSFTQIVRVYSQPRFPLLRSSPRPAATTTLSPAKVNLFTEMNH